MGQKWTEAQREKFRATMAAKRTVGKSTISKKMLAAASSPEARRKAVATLKKTLAARKRAAEMMAMPLDAIPERPPPQKRSYKKREDNPEIVRDLLAIIKRLMG